jgi:uncharacterized integral membrane protein
MKSIALKSKAAYLLQLKPIKFLTVPVCIAIGMWFAGFMLVQLMGKMSAPHWQLVIVHTFYFSIYILIAGVIYKNKKPWLVLIIANIILLLLRLLFAAIFYDMIFARYIIYGTSITAAIMFSVVSGTILIFRIADKKFRFAEIRDIKSNIKCPDTKTTYDTATCCNCGNTTKIAKSRRFPKIFQKFDFWGVKEIYFCDNCGMFLRSNPLISIFLAFSEIVISSLLCFYTFINIGTHNPLVYSTGLIIFAFGVIDGLRRGFCGIKGLVVFKN